MIIEAGYDLHLLLFPDHRLSGSLRMVCMDADLRVTDVRTTIPEFAGVFDRAALDSIEATIPDDHDDSPRLDTRFVALGYDVSTTSEYPEGFDWERVKRPPPCGGDPRPASLLHLRVRRGRSDASPAHSAVREWLCVDLCVRRA